jgi:hypothetical protein
VDAVERMVTVASCGGRLEAELKRSALESDGLRAVVATDDAGGLHPELAALTCGAARVLVPEPEADRATELLAELDAGTHALRDGDHERIAAPPASPFGLWLIAAVLLAFVVYRTATLLVSVFG